MYLNSYLLLKTQNINLYLLLFKFQLNSTIVPTKVLTDPTELDRALSSGIQAVNGFTFDPSTGTFPEAYQVQLKQKCYAGNFQDFVQYIMQLV